MPPLDHLDTDFLGALQRAGVAPESVDVVVNTHVHSDHVGWNTKRDGDSWVPTFPNARYLIPEADYRFFHPDNADARPAARTEDERRGRRQPNCVRGQHPSRRRGRQIELWSDDHQISESLRLRPAPGHTPGSSVLWLDAGKPAVFVGDLTHSPLQLHRPSDPCAFDEDLDGRRGDAQAGAHRGDQATRSGDPRALSGPRWGDRRGPRRLVHGRRLAGNHLHLDFLTYSRKGTRLPNVPTASDFQEMLRGAALRVTRPRVAVLTAVHAHPHADTDSIIRAVRADLPDVSHQAVYDSLSTLTAAGSGAENPAVRLGGPL